MDDRLDRARSRFKGMLADAQAALAAAPRERGSDALSAAGSLSAAKAMNRAGGFLEATGILAPELCLELIPEFEAYAAQVEAVAELRHGDAERRARQSRRARSERRGWDRRLGRDRRRDHLPVSAERRADSDRRDASERRTGKTRELADRRLRAVVHP